MGEETGVTRTIYELFEMILPVAIFILILGGIIIVKDIDSSRAYMLEKEISYISSITSENMVVELDLKNTKYENVKVETSGNKVLVKVNEKTSNTQIYGGSEYFGQGEIERITNGQDGQITILG